MVFLVLLGSAPAAPAWAEPVATRNERIANFRSAKKIAVRIHQDHPTTLYCDCRYSGKKVDLASCGYRVQSDAKRAVRLEWEHVVPAEAFGNAFTEWREGAAHCRRKGKTFKGRKCAETNPEFSRMEADLHNLWPEIGELNGLRSNFSMAQLRAPETKAEGQAARQARAEPNPSPFGRCRVWIEDRKFEPMDSAKGIVARTYLYMQAAYPGRGIVSDKNQKLFEAWNKQYPVTDWECRRERLIFAKQGNANPFVRDVCLARK
jgi:deoxyribonuclease-1